MNNRPTVSVIIPVFNGERFLAQAIGSVQEQTLPPNEIIVVDDGSTDGTAGVVAALAAAAAVPIHPVYQQNQGPAAARNLGVARASGDLIAFLDADDVWTPAKTVHQLAALAHYPEAGAAWGDAYEFAGDSLAAEVATGRHSVASPQFLLQSMLFRRATLEQVGPFDPSLRIGEDVDWLLRAMEQGIRFVLHRHPVVYYRRHGANLTSDRDAARREFYALLKRALDRRRAAGLRPGDRPSPFILPT
ncbi:MAG: hypothetical protein Kow0031_20260 [Anaerolineae bacterium]